MTIFPAISPERIAIEAVTAEKPAHVHVEVSQSGAQRRWIRRARPSVWRMTLTNLGDAEGRAVHAFLEVVSSESTWAIRSGACLYRDCTLVNARLSRARNFDDAGVGWIVFRGIRFHDVAAPLASDDQAGRTVEMGC
jgi:hypothetical protein